MVDEILEPAVCNSCGRWISPVPADGRWRWSQSGKVFDTLVQAEVAAAEITLRRQGWEARAAYDVEGRPRIATRRTVA